MKHKIKKIFRKHRSSIKKISVLLLIAMVFGVLLLLVNKWENIKYPKTEQRTISEQENETDSSEIVRYNGKWYKEDKNIEKILIIGLDKYEKTEKSDIYINNMQADFLALAAIDKSKKTVSFLHINRDTMADVEVLGVSGKGAGSSVMQLALSHTYGSGGNDSCLNTVKAVSDFLFGLKIDHYVAFTMDAVAKINDGIGGVTVNIEDDFSAVDKTLVKGEKITLKGNHALNFVRSRYGLEDSTNIRRMARQRHYLSKLVKKMKAEYKNNGTDSFYDILFSVSEDMTSDLTVNQMKKTGNEIWDFDYEGMYTIEGKAEKGENYIEFHADDNALKKMLIEKYYTCVEKK